MRGNRGLLATLAALALVLAVFEATDLDLRVQDRFFDFERVAWRVDPAAAGPRLVFYRLPKLAISALGIGALAAGLAATWAARRPAWRAALEHRLPPPREAFYLFAVLALVPALAGTGKRLTGVYCPAEVDRYGGPMPYVRLFEPVPPEVAAVKRGRCFPAAHASGGFGLVAFAFVGRRRTRSALWGLGSGWVMGLYQMARGAHYLSHTIVSMLLAWLVALALARLFGLDDEGR